MSSKLKVVPDFALVGLKSARRALSPLCLRAIISRANVLPDIILSFSAGRCRQYLLLPEGFRRNERLRWPAAAECLSRVKCRGGPCRGHSVLPFAGNMISLQCAFIKALDLISACRKHAVAATGSSPFKVGDNQRPKRTMSGVRKTFA